MSDVINKLVNSRSVALLWLPVCIGLIAMYLPTYYNLAGTVWKMDDQGHGPLVLMVVLFLFWQQRDVFVGDDEQLVQPIMGSMFFALGLLLYVLGRSQGVLIFDVGSTIPLLIGIILLTRGSKTLKKLWFPLFFLLFLVPLPGSLLDSVTLPMKLAVSYVAEEVLYYFSYPIGRSGVIIQIGQYKLLVADACAGMHTLISLEALGLLYLNLVKHNSLFRNVTLAILIIPISFTANVVRVIVLTLVTYYYGDAAGQGFVHEFAGMVLFLTALLLIVSVDSLLQYSDRYLRINRQKGSI